MPAAVSRSGIFRNIIVNIVQAKVTSLMKKVDHSYLPTHTVSAPAALPRTRLNGGANALCWLR